VGRELWRSDGMPGHAMLVKDILPGTGHSLPRRLRGAGSTLYFIADDADGWQLWRTDGTGANTVRVTDIAAPGRWPGGDPRNVVDLRGTLYFTANDADVGRTLWRTDGTPETAALVTDVDMKKVANPTELVPLKRSLFFSAPALGVDGALWALTPC